MMAARVLVTGATGYLGRHVLRALGAQGSSAAVLVRDGSAWGREDWHGEAGPVTVVEGTPLDAERWGADAALAGVRTVIHAAGVVRHTRAEPEEMVELNVGGTLQMVQLCARLRARLVFVSSSGTVGCFPFPDMTADEDAPFAESLAGRWPYYASKIRAEREARRLAERLGVELVIARPPVLLGPDDHRRRSTGYVQKVLDGKVPAAPSGGMHFTDVRDVASALARLAHAERARPVYHFPGTATSLREFFAMVSDVSGAPPVQRPLPRWLALSLAHVGKMGGRLHPSMPDPVVLEMSTCHWGLSSLFAHELGYRARPGRQTLSDTVSWLRANRAAPESHVHARGRGRARVTIDRAAS